MLRIIVYCLCFSLCIVYVASAAEVSPYDFRQIISGGIPASGSQANSSENAPSGGSSLATTGQSQPQQLNLPMTILQPGSAGTPVSQGVAPVQPAMAPAMQMPQTTDYLANSNSDVFGAHLFTGAFARQSSSTFNPDYAIYIGDMIQMRLWGGYEFDRTLTVDPKGNIFVPMVGPIQILGIRNQELQHVVEAEVRKVFRSNVYCYASLAAAQPVRVFTGGFVRRPGLYNGTSMDSLLNYLDQAGGIDPERGSFLNVQVKRGSQVRATVNLYDFLLSGSTPMVQLADGDVIFVGSRQNSVKVSGLVQNAKRFEFKATMIPLAEIAQYSVPKAETTHIRVIRNRGPLKNSEYYSIDDVAKVSLGNGDEVEFTADKKPGTITVRVEGEHLSAQEYVLPYGTRFGELIKNIQYTERSDRTSPQLFRQSVKDRQKMMLQTSLRSLEASALTARSATGEEAKLRKDEADLILKWVERAKTIEPTGQVLISGTERRNEMLLENGDLIRIPTKDALVLINGEVLFPNAVAYDPSLSLDDYIGRAGGFTQNANNARIIIAHVDGSFDDNGTNGKIRPGDQILVLPRADTKTRMFFRDVVQIIFQIAMAAKVAIGW